MSAKQTSQESTEIQPSSMQPPPLFTFSSSAEPKQRQIVALLSLITGMVWVFSVPTVLGQITRSETTLVYRINTLGAGDLFVGMLTGLPLAYSKEPMNILALLILSFTVELIANPVFLIVAMGYPFILGIVLGSWYERKGSGFVSYSIDLWARISIPLGIMVAVFLFKNDFFDTFQQNFPGISLNQFLIEQFLYFSFQAVLFLFLWIVLNFLFVMLFILVPASMGYRVGLWITQAVGEEA